MLAPAILNLSPAALAALLAIGVLGGVTKGALGIGLPLVTVPLTALLLDLPVAIGLLAVPMVATNFGQAFEGGGTVSALRQLGPMMAAIILGTLVGVHLLLGIDRHLLNAIVGAVLILLGGMLLTQPRLKLSPQAERWAGPPVGFAAGLLGGISGMFGPPLIAYLVGLGLHPDLFVKHISILFLAATGTLLLALSGVGSLSWIDLLISAAAMLPIQLGIALGRWLRGRVSPPLFRGLVLAVLLFGGLDMLRRGLF